MRPHPSKTRYTHPTSIAAPPPPLGTTGASPAAKTLFTCPRTGGQRTGPRNQDPSSPPQKSLNQSPMPAQRCKIVLFFLSPGF
jgi:hypothetical protein